MPGENDSDVSILDVGWLFTGFIYLRLITLELCMGLTR